ncbi:MAG: MiaB/RimO family radical SAM methylthiotransferase [Candidatus Gottesmanbacteria bacterium]
MNKSKSFFIKTFGCQMNEADSEKIGGWYESRGWKKAKSINEADEIIINTCSVRQSAEHRVMGLINNIKSQNAKVKDKRPRIILTGCMLYHGMTTLKQKLPDVDQFVGVKDLIHNSEFLILNSKAPAFIPIMEGCNNFCTYCVVPYARGREKSRHLDEIICEVKELVKRGTRKIMILGQNVNSFQPSFAELLINLNKISGLEKISFMTSNPWDLTDEIINAMKLPKVDRYLHLPVQSGDDEILRKMNRHYTAKQYLQLVKKIRNEIPEIKIGTDIIVGFPGETEEQFNNTVRLCKKVGFIKAYIARYSPRPVTTAYKLKDNVSPQEKKRRWQILENLINS